jgi:hypothetical protein
MSGIIRARILIWRPRLDPLTPALSPKGGRRETTKEGECVDQDAQSRPPMGDGERAKRQRIHSAELLVLTVVLIAPWRPQLH